MGEVNVMLTPFLPHFALVIPLATVGNIGTLYEVRLAAAPSPRVQSPKSNRRLLLMALLAMAITRLVGKRNPAGALNVARIELRNGVHAPSANKHGIGRVDAG